MTDSLAPQPQQQHPKDNWPLFIEGEAFSACSIRHMTALLSPLMKLLDISEIQTTCLTISLRRPLEIPSESTQSLQSTRNNTSIWFMQMRGLMLLATLLLIFQDSLYLKTCQ
jgi:hypothetical protein